MTEKRKFELLKPMPGYKPKSILKFIEVDTYKRNLYSFSECCALKFPEGYLEAHKNWFKEIPVPVAEKTAEEHISDFIRCFTDPRKVNLYNPINDALGLKLYLKERGHIIVKQTEIEKLAELLIKDATRLLAINDKISDISPELKMQLYKNAIEVLTFHFPTPVEPKEIDIKELARKLYDACAENQIVVPFEESPTAQIFIKVLSENYPLPLDSISFEKLEEILKTLLKNKIVKIEKGESFYFGDSFAQIIMAKVRGEK